MGTPLATVDYTVDDQIRATQVPKAVRDYSFTRDDRVTYSNSAADTITRSGQLVESGLVRDGFDRFQRCADGKMSWGSGSVALDTNLYRTQANVLASDSIFQATKILQRGGTALQASDFTLTNWGASPTKVVTSGSIAGRWRITITASTTPGANPTVRLTFPTVAGTDFAYPTQVFLLVQQGFCNTGTPGAYATVVPESVSNNAPFVSGCSFTWIGTPVDGSTYIFEGLVF